MGVLEFSFNCETNSAVFPSRNIHRWQTPVWLLWRLVAGGSSSMTASSLALLGLESVRDCPADLGVPEGYIKWGGNKQSLKKAFRGTLVEQCDGWSWSLLGHRYALPLMMEWGWVWMYLQRNKLILTLLWKIVVLHWHVQVNCRLVAWTWEGCTLLWLSADSDLSRLEVEKWLLRKERR